MLLYAPLPPKHAAQRARKAVLLPPAAASRRKPARCLTKRFDRSSQPLLGDAAGLTSIVLERCQLEENPLPLLLTLPSLSCITIRTASRGSTEASLPVLTPMRRPQQQLLLQHPGSSTGGRGSRGACRQAHTRAAVVAPAGSGVVGEAAGTCFVNTSITSLSLVDVGLRHLPGCISQLVALEELQLALNHDMALNPATCLPQELTCLSGR